MPLSRLRPRSDTLHVSRGRTVLATGLDGFVAPGSPHGLFVHQTRLLSRHRLLIDGEPPTPVALSGVEQHSWLGYYIALPPGIGAITADQGSGQVSPASQQTLEVRLSRHVGEGLHEDVDLTNFSLEATSFALSIEIEADFADQVEALDGRRRQHGELRTTWQPGSATSSPTFDYRAEHAWEHHGRRGVSRLHRAVRVEIEHAGSTLAWADGRLVFDVRLPPRGAWHACLGFHARIDGEELPLHYGCRAFRAPGTEYDRKRRVFLRDSADFRFPHAHALAPVVVGTLRQAKSDLAALRLHDLDRDEDAWTMAAGLPIYVALFGRDVLTAAWQSALVSDGPMRGTLPLLQRLQGRDFDDWRDEQPGRMLHEAHTGPLEALDFNPRARYYGSITTSAFFPVAVSELWHWTGDRELVAPLVEPALAALQWLDRHADLDGDGFYEYLTRSEHGVRNQAWKDSSDAIVHEDGSQVAPPIATCEEQGFVYIAKLHLSEVLWRLGRREEARRLRREAGELKRRFNEAFWLDAEGFFALGLDAAKRPIRSIASNPGHCLATGIVETDLVRATADRLMAGDLFSGWGIRTLSAAHPAYNPYSYHRGSVWPVEHGTFALGFARYGLHDHLLTLCRAQFEAASLLDFHRLPEAFTGHPRDAEHPFPALYPQANSPQAWSAAAVFCMLQSMLGVYPYAPLGTLLVDPHLPEWLPEITVSGLRVGGAVVTLRFSRRAGGRSDYEVVEQRGTLHVVRQPSPWSMTATWGERLVDAITSMLPGR